MGASTAPLQVLKHAAETVKTRTVPPESISYWVEKIAALEPQVSSVLTEEVEEKAIRVAEMEANKARHAATCATPPRVTPPHAPRRHMRRAATCTTPPLVPRRHVRHAATYPTPPRALRRYVCRAAICATPPRELRRYVCHATSARNLPTPMVVPRPPTSPSQHCRVPRAGEQHHGAPG